VSDTRSGGGIGQRDMYHILAPKCHRQDSTPAGEYHPLRTAPSDPPRLVERAAPVIACIGCVDEEVDLARTGCILYALEAVHELAGTGLHAQPVERRLAKRGLGPFAKIGRDLDFVRLEGPLERALQPSLGICSIELGASDADPRPAARCTGADVGGNAVIGAEREPDQLVPCSLAPGEDARPLGNVRLTLC
jgi:hypothetical protein